MSQPVLLQSLELLALVFGTKGWRCLRHLDESRNRLRKPRIWEKRIRTVNQGDENENLSSTKELIKVVKGTKRIGEKESAKDGRWRR